MERGENKRLRRNKKKKCIHIFLRSEGRRRKGEVKNVKEEGEGSVNFERVRERGKEGNKIRKRRREAGRHNTERGDERI